MISFLSIVVGYAALIAVAGWWGVAALAVHCILMLSAAWRIKDRGFR